MNKTQKYSPWAVAIESPNFSELIQRVAFSFGYQWPDVGYTKNSQIKNTSCAYLVFDPNENEITYLAMPLDIQWLEDHSYPCVSTYTEVLKMFKNPPLIVVDVLKTNFCNINKTGDIFWKDGLFMSGVAFDDLVKTRNEFLGRKPEKSKLPYVSFSNKLTGKVEYAYIVSQEFELIKYFNETDHTTKQIDHKNIIGSMRFIAFLNDPR
jgi:hypothetical protein